MAKLPHEQLEDEIKQLGYTLVGDKNYSNILSRIIIECPHHHLIETCLNDIRKPSFVCPACDKEVHFVNPKAVPPKNGAYRIIAFDQATENFGLSIFDNGKLVFYSLYRFSGTVSMRLVKIRKFIKEIVLDAWHPDFVVFEDIQFQKAVLTFKVLAMLYGIVEELLAEEGITYASVSPNVWRKYAGTAGKNRAMEKQLSKALVKQKYNVDVVDDIAEAILIGQYAVKVYYDGHEYRQNFGG